VSSSASSVVKWKDPQIRFSLSPGGLKKQVRDNVWSLFSDQYEGNEVE